MGIVKTPLKKLDRITRESFEKDYFNKNVPVIIKDEHYQGQELSKWSVESFSKKWGDVKVPIQEYGPGKHHLPHFKEDREFKKITVTDFFKQDSLNNQDRENNPSMMMGKLSTSLFDGMNLSYQLPDVLSKKYFDHKVWVYSKDSVTAMHFDVMDTFLVQGKGKKKVYFFRPGIKGMYAFKFFSKAAHFSEVDARHIDLEKFPKLEGREMIYGELNEGEILYIPFGWWHQLIGEGEMNFALAYWYYPSLLKGVRHFFQGLRLWRIAFIRWLFRYPI
jgi:hypothetical protein